MRSGGARPRSKRARLIFFLMAVVWVGFIFYLSSQPYQKQSIQPLLKRNFTQEKLTDVLPNVSFRYHRATIDAKNQPYQFIEFVFRKLAHMGVYAILAVLLSLALMRYKENGVAKLYLILCLVALVGMWDEWNQTRVSNRTGILKDVGVDLAGGIIGVVFVWFVGVFRINLFHRRNPKKP